MNGITINDLSVRVPLPAGYRFEFLKRSDIPQVIDAIKRWFPNVAVGSASCFLNEDFYIHDVWLEDDPTGEFMVVLVKKDQELAAIYGGERDLAAQTVIARMAAIAPKHRGVQLGAAAPMIVEAVGRALGMGLVYFMATLAVPHIQVAAERMGWQLAGIMPGSDREMVAPGVVKRVYEAVYVKVLVADKELLRPDPQNLTPKTKALFDLLFSEPNTK